MSPPYVIVWDLDKTLGDFSALNGQADQTGSVRILLRPGLAGALDVLSAAGFTHTVLTLATPLYAETVLRAAGLRDRFARVEGLGQRPKGDAAGVADAFGIPERERPHRMFFVGDNHFFDRPDDTGVVFHLELFALERPASAAARLVLRLRELGGGSVRRGFDRLLPSRPWWRVLTPWRPAHQPGQPARVCLPEVGELLLLSRAGYCPVVGFETGPTDGASPDEHTFVPAELVPQVEAELGKR